MPDLKSFHTIEPTLLPPSHGEVSDLCNAIGQKELDPSHFTENLHSSSCPHSTSFVNSHWSVQHGPSLGLKMSHDM